MFHPGKVLYPLCGSHLPFLCFCSRSGRLDWMYQGGMLAKQEADQRTEEAMMSGKPVQQEESAELNRVKCVMLADQSLH